MAKTSDALKIIDSLTGNDSEMENLVREASLNAIVAQLIYEARTARGLTQKQLADRVGTKQSAIARLEDADYDGHSLSMLQKIASALNQKVEIKFAEIELETSLI
ncbi:helix-turn-helix domain-containing protein [Tumidithrix elongata RA019]|uniref:Helix-turn-helix domain-containing protein n=1 Tax=Tumidithrix elongata BACA0141 TaxID=2716417 RepID=A0AAW9PXF3_9CYAN|nr:helix-turn-helix domain-containing protein [Tumidithrix elongata RA019]